MSGYDPETDESCVEQVNSMVGGWILVGIGASFILTALGLVVGHFLFDVPMHNKVNGGTVPSAGIAIIATVVGLIGLSMVAGGRFVLRCSRDL